MVVMIVVIVMGVIGTVDVLVVLVNVWWWSLWTWKLGAFFLKGVINGITEPRIVCPPRARVRCIAMLPSPPPPPLHLSCHLSCTVNMCVGACPALCLISGWGPVQAQAVFCISDLMASTTLIPNHNHILIVVFEPIV